ncbi:hypothetical protein B7463_g11538, partial [Scytalidium lignicola]
MALTICLMKVPLGRAYIKYTAGTKITEPTAKEKKAFDILQFILSKPTYLAHLNPNRRLYIDLDASKEYGFGAVAYHVKGDEVQDPKDKLYPKRNDIELILFFSRSLSAAE